MIFETPWAVKLRDTLSLIQNPLNYAPCGFAMFCQRLLRQVWFALRRGTLFLDLSLFAM